MAKGIHLFPYRTQKLSLSAPMVLGWRRPGRVGRCRIPQRKSLRRCLGLFLCGSRQFLLPGRFQANVQHCTWLGSPMRAASGGSSTWGNTWESRTLPDSMKKRTHPLRGGFFFHSICNVLTLWSSSMNVRHCTWLGFFLPPAVWGSGRKNHLGE